MHFSQINFVSWQQNWWMRQIYFSLVFFFSILAVSVQCLHTVIKSQRVKEKKKQVGSMRYLNFGAFIIIIYFIWLQQLAAILKLLSSSALNAFRISQCGFLHQIFTLFFVYCILWRKIETDALLGDTTELCFTTNRGFISAFLMKSSTHVRAIFLAYDDNNDN